VAVADGALRIRDARSEDWPAVGALLEQLGRPSAAGANEPALRRVYVEFLARPDTRALVAEQDERVVGFCNLLLLPRLNFPGPQGWVPDLVVAESERSRGIGAALLGRAEELARDRGCWSVFLTSANWRDRSHAFYRREGWEQSGQYFSKSLTGEPWPPPAPRSEA
jgi:GNAT superfamily N-acetyltransferase